MGEPFRSKYRKPYDEYIVVGSEPEEVKHLSTLRKRNRTDFPSSGERKGNSLNLFCFRKKTKKGLWGLVMVG